MSNTITLQQFLVGKKFIIPSYQRDYAWTTAQVEDLFSDIQEAITTDSSHYIGTVVLADRGNNYYELVDGQQRLTTLNLIIHSLLKQLPDTDPRRLGDAAILIGNEHEKNFDLGNNQEFFLHLLEGENCSPHTAGQRKLVTAFNYTQDRGNAILHAGGRDNILYWLDTLKKLELIEFVAQDTGSAIRMFQTVNDRGLPLSTMDKAKALLVYYSNRYLNGELDNHINECFGVCFSAYDQIREKVGQKEFRIDNIAREGFSEDDLLRYHYLAYDHQDAKNARDWDGSLKTVFDGFLKRTLKTLSETPNLLNDFLTDYTTDLRDFCSSFKNLVESIETTPKTYKILVVLGISARLYPLTIRLFQRDQLFESVTSDGKTLSDLIITSDLRVYKTRGTEPAKDVGIISHVSRDAEINEIASSLGTFTTHFMPDGHFQTCLEQDMYHNRALPFIFIEYEEYQSGKQHDSEELKGLIQAQVSREHILSQEPNFSIQDHDFEDEDDFLVHVHQLGNLTPLTRTENSRCSNASIHDKMTDEHLYPASRYCTTRNLAHQYQVGDQTFDKSDLQRRTKDIASWVMDNWPLWEHGLASN